MLLFFLQDSLAQAINPVVLDSTNQVATSLRDTINVDSILPVVEQSIELIRVIAENTHPEPYTIQGLTVNIYALIVGILSAILAGISAKYSYHTATSVEKVNKKTQEKLLIDLIRHLYRNEICTLAFVDKWKKNPGQYPADEHLLKLQTLPDDLHLERYNSEPEHYEKMHELGILLRNYNTEIEVTHKHISDPDISRKVIERELDTLIFKPIYLINRITNAMEEILNRKSTLETANILILLEHYKKLIDNYKGDVWTYKEEVDVWLDAKTESWIEKLIVKETDRKRNKKEKQELKKIYEECLTNANLTDKEFTEKDLKRLNELNKKEADRKKRKMTLEESEKNELNRLRKRNLNAVIQAETKGILPDKLKWNNLKLILEVIKTDVIIEYTKIGMNEYPIKEKNGDQPDEELNNEYNRYFTLIKSILAQKIPENRISYQQKQNYMAIRVDNKNFCLLYLSGKNKYIKIKDSNNSWVQIDMDAN